MADTTFTDYTTPVVAAWLNDVNGHVYNDTPVSPATAVHDAALISNTPAGNIAATTVQAAINELDTEKVPLAGTGATGTWGIDISGNAATASDAAAHISDTTAAHAASAIANTAAGNIVATDVQAAINELDTEKAALAGATFTGPVVCNDLVSASGGSIRFPNTQSPSAGVNDLDDYQEASYSFTPTATSGTFTTVTGTAIHTKVGNKCTVAVEIIITDAGTAAGDILYTLPYTARIMSGKYNGVGAAKEVQATGVAGIQSLNSSTAARISKYDGTTLIASSRTVTGTLTFLTDN